MKIFKKLNKNVISLGTVSLFNDVASEMIYPFLPVFLSRVLNTGTVFIGLIEGIAEAGGAVFKLLSGIFSDIIKKRKFLVLSGYTLATLARPLIGITTHWSHILFLRFFDRTGKGIRTSPRDALISLSTEKKNIGRAFGFQRAMDHLGAFLGPCIALILLNYLNLRQIFFFALIPGLISVGIVLFAVREKKPIFQQTSGVSFKKLPKKLLFYIFILFLFTLGNSSDAFLLLKANFQGMTLFNLSIFWAVFHLIKSLTSLPGGVLSDKIGRKKVIIGGWLVYAIVYTGFAFSKSFNSFLGLFLIYGIYFGATEGVERALISDLSSQNIRGTAFGLYHITSGISLFFASVIFGILWKLFGDTVPFLFGASLAGIASILLIFL